jgi:hypothetical protein
MAAVAVTPEDFRAWAVFVQALAALAWPSLWIVVAYVYREPIGGLIGRILKAKGLGLEAEFAKPTEEETVLVTLPSQVVTAGTEGETGGAQTGPETSHPA